VTCNGCDTTPTIAADALDIDGRIDGAETEAEPFDG